MRDYFKFRLFIFNFLECFHLINIGVLHFKFTPIEFSVIAFDLFWFDLIRLVILSALFCIPVASLSVMASEVIHVNFTFVVICINKCRIIEVMNINVTRNKSKVVTETAFGRRHKIPASSFVTPCTANRGGQGGAGLGWG